MYGTVHWGIMVHCLAYLLSKVDGGAYILEALSFGLSPGFTLHQHPTGLPVLYRCRSTAISHAAAVLPAMPTVTLEQLQNPTNVILLVVLLYLAYPILASLVATPAKAPTSHLEAYSWMPASHPDSIVWQEFTPRTLRPHDGTQSDKSPILFAIRGKVYDVTSGRSFYGPGGPYGTEVPLSALPVQLKPQSGNFAGRDASRGLVSEGRYGYNSCYADIASRPSSPLTW